MRVGQAGTQYSVSKGQTNIGHSLLSKTTYWFLTEHFNEAHTTVYSSQRPRPSLALVVFGSQGVAAAVKTPGATNPGTASRHQHRCISDS